MSVEDISSNVSLVVIAMLKSLRRVDKEPTCKRRKKVNVKPEKSISSPDLIIPGISIPCNSKDQQEDDNNEKDNNSSKVQALGIKQHSNHN